MNENLPIQKLSRSKKGKAWGKSVIDYFEGLPYFTSNDGRSSRTNKIANYRLFNGIINESDYKYVTDPYELQLENPAKFQHYDKISPKLMLLEGEELKRPFNFKCVARNHDITSELQNKKKELLFNSLMQELQNKMNPELADKPQTPEEIEEYMQTKYSGLQEITGQKILDYLVDDQDLRSKFNQMFHDALVTGEEIMKVSVVGGEPIARVCNPCDITIVKDPDSPYIDDAFVILEERWMTLPSVVDEFYDVLTPDDIKNLEKGTIPGSQEATTFFTRPLVAVSEDEISGESKARSDLIRVLNCEWKSFRRLGLLTYLEDMQGGEAVYHSGRESYDEIVDAEIFSVPEYAKKEDGCYYFDGIKYEEVWVNEYWEGTKIDTDIYVNIRPLKHQRRDMENPSKCYSSYCGFIHNSRNADSVSMIDRLKSFNFFYDIIYYRIELAFAKDKGRVFVMDLAQVPTGEGWGVEKWMHYISSSNIVFINSAEEGYQEAQGQFNQFQAVDLETGRFIDKHVLMLDKLEREMSEISGVLPQRLGQTSQYEAVTNVQQNIVQSSHITELWFYNHNQVKKRVLEALIYAAKQAWKGGKKINYILGDLSRVIIDIDEKFPQTEYGVFVSDSADDDKALEAMRSLAQPAIQAGNLLLSEAAELYRDKSMERILARLKKGERRREQQTQAQAQAEQKAVEEKIKRDEIKNIRDNETKIKVALISATNGNETEMPEDDTLDEERLELEREKFEKDYDLKERQLSETVRKNKESERLKEKQIAKSGQKTK